MCRRVSRHTFAEASLVPVQQQSNILLHDIQCCGRIGRRRPRRTLAMVYFGHTLHNAGAIVYDIAPLLHLLFHLPCSAPRPAARSRVSSQKAVLIFAIVGNCSGNSQMREICGVGAFGGRPRVYVFRLRIEVAVAIARKARYRSRQAQSGRRRAGIRTGVSVVCRQILQQVCDTVA